MPIPGARSARALRAQVRAVHLEPIPPEIAWPLGGTSVAPFVCVIASFDQHRFQPSPAVKASISGDGLVLLDVDGGLVLASNLVGARIWQLLERRHGGTDIARQLAGEYAIPLDRAERDVAAFVTALIARGLVVADLRP